MTCSWLWIGVALFVDFCIVLWLGLKVEDFELETKYKRGYNDGYTDRQNGRPNKVRPS